jgi:hypothetical protein
MIRRSDSPLWGEWASDESGFALAAKDATMARVRRFHIFNTIPRLTAFTLVVFHVAYANDGPDIEWT